MNERSKTETSSIFEFGTTELPAHQLGNPPTLQFIRTNKKKSAIKHITYLAALIYNKNYTK